MLEALSNDSVIVRTVIAKYPESAVNVGSAHVFIFPPEI